MRMTWMKRGVPLWGTAVLSAVMMCACSDEAPSGGAEAPPEAVSGEAPPPADQGAPPAGEAMAPAEGQPAGAAGEVQPEAAPADGALAANAAPNPSGDAAPAADGAPPAAGGPTGQPGERPAGPPPPANPMKLTDLPKDIESQEALKGSGKGILVKGFLKGDSCQGKTIRIDAIQKTSGKTPLLLTTALVRKDVGAFEFYIPKGQMPTWVLANCDVDGDGQLTPGTDMSAAYAKNPITPNAPVDGAVMTFTKERITEGMPPGPGELQGKGAVPPEGGGLNAKSPSDAPDPNAKGAADGGAPPSAGAPGGAK